MTSTALVQNQLTLRERLRQASWAQHVTLGVLLVLTFEIASVLLTAALVGAIMLVRSETEESEDVPDADA